MNLMRVVWSSPRFVRISIADPAEARKGQRSGADHADKRSRLALQVALDRVGFSPGPKDGQF